MIAADVLVSASELPMSVHLTLVPLRSVVTLATDNIDVSSWIDEFFNVILNDFLVTTSGPILRSSDETSRDLITFSSD